MNIFLKHPKYEAGRVLKVTYSSNEIVKILHAEPGVGQYDQPQYKVVVISPKDSLFIGRTFMFPEPYLDELPPLIELAVEADE